MEHFIFGFILFVILGVIIWKSTRKKEVVVQEDNVKKETEEVIEKIRAERGKRGLKSAKNSGKSPHFLRENAPRRNLPRPLSTPTRPFQAPRPCGRGLPPSTCSIEGDKRRFGGV